MKILTRMGDSSNVELTLDELRKDFEEGSDTPQRRPRSRSSRKTRSTTS